MGQKTGLCLEVRNSRSLYVDVEWRSIYQTVQLYIQSKSGVSYITIFKYYLRNFSATTLY